MPVRGQEGKGGMVRRELCDYFDNSSIFYYQFESRQMNNRFTTFDSAKIGQNLMWEGPLATIQNQQYKNTLKAKTRPKLQNSPQKPSAEPQQQIMNLEDVWNSIEHVSTGQNPVKIQIMDIGNQPEGLTVEELEEVFGKQENNGKGQVGQKKQEEALDLGDLWDQIDQATEQVHPPVQKVQTELGTPQQKEQVQFYQVNQKQEGPPGQTCLTIGKNFQIFDISTYLLSCYQPLTYSYLGFAEVKPNHYILFNLTTKEILLSCSVQKYQQFTETTAGKKISFETDYCLKIRLANGELLATMWKKSICNGVFFNLRRYNTYEHKYDDCLALIEVEDGYIGQFCYCNTTAHLSQKYSKEPGPFEMKLSLKNGYLISRMGVSGIKSAPYNCRLQNSCDSFVYLLGLMEKEQERESFLVKVGEGMSPLVAFAISVGRKRFIDSFKE